MDIAVRPPPSESFRQRDAAHDAKVLRVAQALRGWPAGRPVSLKKRAVPHQVPKRHDARRTDGRIDLSDLDAILDIDVVGRTCTAEPGVTFETLVRACLPHGLVPLVVPELRTITVGGAVSGCSLESTSFVYGGFHDTCLAYEVVTTDGEVLHCTPENENALVFQMVHGSFGTLGVLTKLVFRLMPAEPFVHVTYERFGTLAAYEEAIVRHARRRDVDFMDGFVFGPTRYVLSVGRFVRHAPYTNSYAWLKVYYRSTAARREDYLATEEYFFRYDNGVTNVHPKSFLARLVFGKFVHSDQLLRMAETLHTLLPEKSPDVTVDTFLPLSKAAGFLAWYDEAIGHYPIWCVPYRRVRDYEWLDRSFYEGVDDEIFLDLAVYGVKQPPGRNLYAEIEVALSRFNGVKTLISHNFYDEETFWRTWNKANYEAAKRVTDPRGLFRDLYAKTCVACRAPAD